MSKEILISLWRINVKWANFNKIIFFLRILSKKTAQKFELLKEIESFKSQPNMEKIGFQILQIYFVRSDIRHRDY